MRKILIYFLLLTVFLTGCYRKKVNVAPSTPTPTPAAAQTPTTAPSPTPTPVPTPLYTPEPILREDGKTFSLTASEQKIYDEFIQKLDVNIFKDMPETSIAKIFIQCGVDGNWEQEFTMYSPEGLPITKADHERLNANDISTIALESRRDMANFMFAELGDGEFIQDSDLTGHISFFAGEDHDEPLEFYLIKNGDGIWLVKYNPFDAPAE